MMSFIWKLNGSGQPRTNRLFGKLKLLISEDRTSLIAYIDKNAADFKKKSSFWTSKR